ncbi:DUF3658 domain-containing protein [Bradyrhizobium sp. ARR65]|uniref:DUF3658 domain-containing protein n=1 Tax=Bradyrhizobium sp. ARR65 TaxID=1040989 RepID=UPI0004678EB7|nr:DUF3658 domain-containing protein [Bradyrhizobium sp. ARR65]
MDREQAAEIHEYLLDAAYAIDEARAAILALDEHDRGEFTAPLETVVTALHSELLRGIYDRFPDLIPFREFPAITSALRWDQVRIPPSVSEADIDSILFSVMEWQWRKMALVVGMAYGRCKELGLPFSDEALAARIQVLVKSGRLEAQGDLRRWRHSEVRLKG